MLASASPRRRELLAGIGARFVVRPAHADETIAPGTPPEAAAVALAERKARIVLAMSSLALPGGVALVAAGSDLPVLAADTIVVAADGGILGKPAGTREARAMLARLGGTTHRVITGVCLAVGARARTAAVTTRVTMRPLEDAEMDAYARSGEPFGKAGGYAIQERGDRFVTSVEGSWSNVVGLPLEVVAAMLREEGLL